MGMIRTTRATARVMMGAAWLVCIVRSDWVVVRNRRQTVMSGVARVRVRVGEVRVVVIVGHG
jgi:hypothetical protein